VTAHGAPETFTSGETGNVGGLGRRLAFAAGDRALDALERARGTGAELDRLAGDVPQRGVVVLGAYVEGGGRLPAAVRELRRSRHHVELALCARGSAHPDLAGVTVLERHPGAKFENVNAAAAAHRERGGAWPPDWALVVDDDVDLPGRFLDRFLGLCERFGLSLAQPAQTLRSHAAWGHVRRRPGSLLRETRFVEIGPVTAFRGEAAAELMPFPEVGQGWGLDLHWGAVAEERGWRSGIVDALPVRHESQLIGVTYSGGEALESARRFLAERPYLSSSAARETLATHRRVS
jgi:hypothetical protein